MADFVAVIKRAVDGLPDNTPALRARVYEKARAAVRRQLENMTPRPPDAAINAQLAKLEEAIGSVEAENAAPEAVDEGLVFEDLESIAPDPEPATAPPARQPETARPPVAREPEPEPEPEAAPEPEVEPQPAPIASEPAHPPVSNVSVEAEKSEPRTPQNDAAPDAGSVAPVEPPRDQAAAEQQAKVGPAPVPFGTYAIGRAPSFPIPPRREPQPEPEAPREGFMPSRYQTGFAPRKEEPSHAEDEASEFDDAPLPAPEPVSATVLPEDESTAQEFVVPVGDDAPLGHDEPAPMAEEAEPVAAHDLEQAEADEERWEPTAGFTTAPDVADEPQAHEVWPQAADNEVHPATSVPVSSQNADPDDFFEEEMRRHEADYGAPPTTGEQPDWPEEDDRHDAPPEAAAAAVPPAAAEDRDRRFEEAQARAAARRSDTVQKKPAASGRGKRIALVLILLLSFAGLGYAGWANQERLVALFSGDTAQEAGETPPTETAEGETPTPGADTGEADGVEKYTQRLLPNGSEVDPGAATPEGEEAENAEGRSLAVQSDEEAATGNQPEGAEITENEVSESAVANEQAAEAEEGEEPGATEVAGAGQTMFLYEERQGDAAPTALEGSVAWSLVEEPASEGGQPEQTIRGEITVPENEFSARMTIRRNTDDSLPASHLIEIVFSLPEDFGGGGIESVRRVAFKDTEQDRGDALIAVPAKITDDFFMVALNDYQEAVTTNSQLMRERPWIDIPIVYANGRRALITLDKGEAGTEIFNQALSQWARMTPPSANQPAATEDVPAQNGG